MMPVHRRNIIHDQSVQENIPTWDVLINPINIDTKQIKILESWERHFSEREIPTRRVIAFSRDGNPRTNTYGHKFMELEIFRKWYREK